MEDRTPATSQGRLAVAGTPAPELDEELDEEEEVDPEPEDDEDDEARVMPLEEDPALSPVPLLEPLEPPAGGALPGVQAPRSLAA